MIAALYALLLSYHSTHVNPSYRHEPEDARLERLHMIAKDEVEECQARPIPGFPFKACVAFAAVTPKWESGFIREIHEGTKLGAAGERCLYQLHRQVTLIPNPEYAITYDEWFKTIGLDEASTKQCVMLGMRDIRWQIHRCHLKYNNGDWYTAAKVFAEYHHPSNSCTSYYSSNGAHRASDYVRYLKVLPEE
jgi:hypothetical protein